MIFRCASLSFLGAGLVFFACAATAPQEVPGFQFRIRVLKNAGGSPAGHRLRIHLGSVSTEALGGDWSVWVSSGSPARYTPPHRLLTSGPTVVRARIDGASNPAIVEAEILLDETGEKRSLRWEPFGPTLGLIFWRDSENRAHAETMAEYNRRYWKEIEGLQIPDGMKPKKFPLIDRFIGEDDDRLNWVEGMKNLSSIGVNVLLVPPSKPIREALHQVGVTRAAWAVYSPPGYAFPAPPGTKDTPSPASWAKAQAKAFTDQGFDPSEVALFNMSDEPGWYYPAQYAMLQDPEARIRFQGYLQSKGLQPGDLGRDGWATVEPLGPAGVKDLPTKRLFYWTQRFFSWDSAHYFAQCTRELEHAFYQGLLIATNWNFFSGRLYVPGPAASNRDKLNPDAAMGGHDWLEFATERGGTELWTEDWFTDAQAYQWSFYAAKLRSAAKESGVGFGGYVVPRASGDRDDGLMQKILTLIGSGGKAVDSYVFGPEYAFPGNCYSDLPNVLKKLAKTYRMIGAAEDVLWPGTRPPAQVAILAPRSAELWDAPASLIPFQIQDATNTNLNGATVDYMAEVADLYVALQHANVPVDFVDEDSLSRPNGLANVRVLYITEPDIPEEAQRGVADWVRGGGTLVSSLSAGTMDRYDEPCSILTRLGFSEKQRERLYIRNLEDIKQVGTVRANDGQAVACAARGALIDTECKVIATFEDSSPAIVRRHVGKGAIVHFAWLPGLSYVKSSSTAKAKLPWNFSSVIRDWIVAPALSAEVEPLVRTSAAMVETPLLVSKAGAALTVLNWNNEPVQNLRMTVRVNFPVKTVTSVLKGPIHFNTNSRVVHFSISVEGADVIALRP